VDQKELVLDALRKLHELMSACNSEVTDQLGVCELKVTQIRQLKIIANNKGLTFGRFAEILNITRPSVTEIVNKLIRMDCVKKIKSEEDGRIFYLETTEKGRKIATQDYLRDRIIANKIFETLDETEIYLFTRAINKISC
jgi:DNA-binding MarR family transcriptional regulator